MSDVVRLVIVRVDDRRYALPLATVERVIHAVEVTPLPNAPPIVLGAINIEGRVVPVLDLRKRFGLASAAITVGDWFVLAHTSRQTVVLVVDASEGVIERPETEIIASTQISSSLPPRFPGVVTLDDQLVFIHNLEAFLSVDEARAVDDAIAVSQPER